MAESTEIELIQGKTWEFTGTALDRDGLPILWTDYGIRGKARKAYSDPDAAWDWIMTPGASGEYAGFLGAVTSAAVAKGTYVSDIEIYSLTDVDIVHEISRMVITVVPEATK